jgi:rhodanese-related sulfurtransferase
MSTAVNAQTLKQWLDNNEVVLIDVREPDEYRDAHIKGSVLLPLGTLSAAALPSATGKKLVMQCKSGGRSARACAKLIEENSALQPINLAGGIMGWIEEGLPVEKGV